MSNRQREKKRLVLFKKRKKRRIVVNKKIMIRNLVILLVIGILVFGITKAMKWYAYKESRKTDIVVTVKDADGIDGASRNLIKTWFERYFTSLALLEADDMTDLYEKGDLEEYKNAKVNQLLLDSFVFFRSQATENLGFRYARIYATVESVKETDDTFTVTVVESHEIQFLCMDTKKSYTTGIRHTFVIRKGNDAKIISHKDDASYEGIEILFENETNFFDVNSMVQLDLSYEVAKSTIEGYILNYFGSVSTKMQYYNANISEFTYDTKGIKAYDRDQAASYALKYTGELEIERNTEDFVSYDLIGGNCTNFTSQCINAGGVSFDTTGKYQWKYFSDELNEGQGASGRSPSWTDVKHFYRYCYYNDEGGIASICDANLFWAEKGDIIQIKNADEWIHSLIVTDVITNAKGEIVDFVVCSNTVDRKNYPFHAYGLFYGSRLIKILGQYE